jgi:hypothetical protein
MKYFTLSLLFALFANISTRACPIANNSFDHSFADEMHAAASFETCTDTLELGVQAYNSLCSGMEMLDDLWINPSVLFPPGGVWTFPNGSVVEDGVVTANPPDPSGGYTYYYENSEGCTEGLSMFLDINPDGGEQFPSNTINICLSDPPFAPFDSLLGIPASLNGTWIYFDKWDGLLIFSGPGEGVTWTIDPADYGYGNPMEDGYLVYYSADPGCGFSSDTLFVEVFDEGGTVSTSDPRMNLCIGDGESNIIEVEVTGNEGPFGRFGIVEATTLDIVAGSATGVFDMENYPPGSYLIGHVSYTDEDFLVGVNNIDDLEGCYALSNLISVSSFSVDGGTISTDDPLAVCVNDGIPSSVSFEVEGDFGPNTVWAILDQGFTEVLNSNQTGNFGLDNFPPGTYKVVYAAYGNDVMIDQVDPQNIQGCVNTSNILTLEVVDCNPTLVQVNPNPTVGRAQISFESTADQYVEIEVYDLTGKKVKSVYSGMTEDNKNQIIETNLDHLTNGVYLLHLRTESSTSVSKIIVNK